MERKLFFVQLRRTISPSCRRGPTIRQFRQCWGGWHFPVGAQDQQAWYRSLKLDSLNQRLAIEEPKLGLVGTANIVSIDWQNRTAFHGMLIGDESVRGKGVALDAVMALMRFVFNEMGLFRLDSDIIEYNAASIKFYTEKAGWRREGVREGWFFRNGRRWDKVIVGITADEYRDHSHKTGYWQD